jgi:hypothetical protein
LRHQACVPLDSGSSFRHNALALWPGVQRNSQRENPNFAESLEHRPPEELVSEIIEKERRILAIMQEIQTELAAGAGSKGE